MVSFLLDCLLLSRKQQEKTNKLNKAVHNAYGESGSRADYYLLMI